MNSREIYHNFIEFFGERNHIQMASSSLIPPANDPTVLLTTAGMQQMIPYFMGLQTPPSTRMMSLQKCFRTVDIDEVGDESHCTFFEMLGNFSVGDYFKLGSLQMGWQLLTEDFGIDEQRLSVTVYPSDDETRQIWLNEFQLPPERIFDDPGNIWGPVGASGVCGPNSEIYVDLGAEHGCGEPDCGPTCERCSRYLEVWNHVFIEWFQETDGTRRELERKNIDTGMGLERISMVLQNANSIYDTDIYAPIMRKISELSGKAYRDDATHDRSIRVIADHARAITFLISDGVLPSNEGRGYVLRRVLRRAVRHGRVLGLSDAFLEGIVDVVITEFALRYPDLEQRRATIMRVVANEEANFSNTLAVGMQRFDEVAAQLTTQQVTTVPGAEAFRLYDTYGFPLELTAEMARERGLEIDEPGFAVALDESRARSRSAGGRFADDARRHTQLYAAFATTPVEFVGYERSSIETTITHLLSTEAEVAQLESGDAGEIVLAATPFYGESGGQVGDTGFIRTETGVFQVNDTQRPAPNLLVHRGEVSEGFVQVGQAANAAIDTNRRDAIRRNHTATHLLHRALRDVLGPDTHQAGSLVAPDRLRFDFTSQQPLSAEGIAAVSAAANAWPLRNAPVEVETKAYADAVADGAMALFGEKYGDAVRVVTIDSYSAELCGGTHVAATGEIGPIVILSESSIGSGIRRIEAVTGEAALAQLFRANDLTGQLTQRLRSTPDHVLQDVEALQLQLRDRERTIDELRRAAVGNDLESIRQQVTDVAGVALLAAPVNAADRQDLLNIGDQLRDGLSSGVIVIAATIDGAPALLAMVTKDIVARGVSAGKLIQELAPIVGGRGGGRPDMAQGGGTDSTKIPEALAAASAALERQLSGT